MTDRSRVVAVVVLAAALVAGVALFLSKDGANGTGGAAVPQDVTAEDIRELNHGVALMGKFDFPGAVDVFEKLIEKYPDWPDLRLNYGISLLNRSRPDTKDLDRALALMLGVQKQLPENLRARHCAGLILLYRGQIDAALPFFEFVATRDENDPYSAYFLGDCLRQVDRVEEAITWFEQARDRDPSLRSAYHALFQSMRWVGREEEAAKNFEIFQKLKDNPQARVAEIKYTRMGVHGMTRALDLPGAQTPPVPAGPVFLDPALLELAQTGGLNWSANDERASITAADLDGDGATDLFLAAALAGDRPNLVLLRRGEGFQAALDHPLGGADKVRTALFGDYDNDGLLDVYLCRSGPNQLWRQIEQGDWKDVTEDARVSGGDHDTLDGAFVDVDHDGDLDLMLVHASAPLQVLVNRLDGSFMPMPEDAGFLVLGDPPPARGLVLGDFDHDRDLDVLVLRAAPPHDVFINDRLWQWRKSEAFADLVMVPAHAGLCLDADADGQEEIYLAGADTVQRWTPGEDGTWAPTTVTTVANGNAWVHLGVLDADGDARLELLVVDGTGPRLVDAQTGALEFGGGSEAVTTDPRCIPIYWSAAQGYALAGQSPTGAPVVWKPGSGRYAMAALTFSGLHKESESMRSNASGIGTRAAVRVDSKWTVHGTYRVHSGPGQSLQPLMVGLAGEPRVDFIDLLWTDGLVQTEDNLARDELHEIQETQRQTSSCPVLFVWDGARYAFVSDILGVGGVGFWVAPQTYAPPTPRESFLLPAGLLKPKGEQYVLKIGEPMEEGCYLDDAVLEVHDLPPGWNLTLDERMQIEGPAPTGDAIYYRREANPVQAVDQDGRDVLAAVTTADLKAAPVGPVDRRFIGRTRKEQVISLTFDAPLEENAKPVLVTDGWIEYPYAQTMFAAWQADATYDAPTVEARGADGVWQVVLKNYGYPAGMPRQSSVALTGLPAGTRQLRIRTNQEVYWDRLFVVYAEEPPSLVIHEVGLENATLAVTGFALRTTNHQRLPHYDYSRRAPLWNTRHQDGWYTKLGDVLELVSETDDAVVVFGPGEEVELRFGLVDAPLDEGWTRRHVLRTTGWCKDMDLFTKDGETIGPLPVRAADGSASAERDALHARFQTRYRSGR